VTLCSVAVEYQRFGGTFYKVFTAVRTSDPVQVIYAIKGKKIILPCISLNIRHIDKCGKETSRIFVHEQSMKKN